MVTNGKTVGQPTAGRGAINLIGCASVMNKVNVLTVDQGQFRSSSVDHLNLDGSGVGDGHIAQCFRAGESQGQTVVGDAGNHIAAVV